MEEGKKTTPPSKGRSAGFVTGAIALVFLIIGYEAALFIQKAAVTRIVANRDRPDTVYVYVETPGQAGGDGLAAAGPGPVMADPDRPSAVRRNARHAPVAEAIRRETRRVESFRFNPNTVSVEDLERLGFTEKQAQAIDRYRQAGGRFRRKADFARSFVVADSVYARLEPFIAIPKLDINKADSAALLDLPGIGPFFAGKVVQYRTQLRGYSTPEQLMEIWHFDREKYDGLKDLITCSEPEPFPLWTLPEAELAAHPHISRQEARGIVLFRQYHTPEQCTLEGLKKAGVLSEEHAGLLERCRLSPAL